MRDKSQIIMVSMVGVMMVVVAMVVGELTLAVRRC